MATVDHMKVFNVLQILRDENGNEEGFSDISVSDIAARLDCSVQSVNACLSKTHSLGLTYTDDTFRDLSVVNGEMLILVEDDHDASLFNITGDLIPAALELKVPLWQGKVNKVSPRIRVTITKPMVEPVKVESNRLTVQTVRKALSTVDECFVGTCLTTDDVTYIGVSKVAIRRKLEALYVLDLINARIQDNCLYIW